MIWVLDTRIYIKNLIASFDSNDDAHASTSLYLALPPLATLN